MPDVKRTVKLVTQQSVNNDPPEAEGFPMRSWSISIFLVGPDGEEIVPNCFEKATYVLHESFGTKRMRQTFKQPPFTINEKGWGEFDMQILLLPMGGGKSSEHTLGHDLNFQQERYESTHNITFRNPKPELLALLKDSGPVPSTGDGATNGTGAPPQKKKKAGTRNVDMEKLAEALPHLGEDDLLQVVQMVHDNKSEDTYTKNDVENGEFHVDLYTLPDNLIKMLWDFASNRVDMSGLS
ncbi:hypothetical protein MBLNU230_g0110t1 [Neophaeotheca triangularis]